MGNYDASQAKLDQDISKWESIANVKEGQKTVQLEGKKDLFASVSKVFASTIESGRKMLDEMDQVQEGTTKHVIAHSGYIEVAHPDPGVVSSTLQQFDKLRGSIVAAGRGFEQLQNTYRKSTKSDEISDKLALQQKDSTGLLALIDIKTQSAILKASTFMGNTDAQKEDVKSVLDGKGISLRLVEVKDESSGTGTFIPGEITTELPRLDLTYNGVLLSSSKKPGGTSDAKVPSQSVKAYTTLCEKFGENSATVLLLLCGQANIATLTSAAWEVASELLQNNAPSGVSPFGKGMQCFIDVKGDNTIITVNTRIHFVDNEHLEEYKNSGEWVKGYGVVTRAITIPTAALKNVELDKEVDEQGFERLKINNTGDLVSEMTVIDSYTPLLPSDGLAMRAQTNGYMER